MLCTQASVHLARLLCLPCHAWVQGSDNPGVFNQNFSPPGLQQEGRSALDCILAIARLCKGAESGLRQQLCEARPLPSNYLCIDCIAFESSEMPFQAPCRRGFPPMPLLRTS